MWVPVANGGEAVEDSGDPGKDEEEGNSPLRHQGQVPEWVAYLYISGIKVIT